MPTPNAFAVRRLAPADLDLFARSMTLFGEAFEDLDRYTGARPGPAYVARLLADPRFVALAAVAGGAVVGALAAYELVKFERETSEFYVYDLAVAAAWRRRGVATALLAETRAIAARCGAWTVFLQADYGDDPAIALYEKLGRREEVLHFELPVP